MTTWSEIQAQRTDAAQVEWERNRRVVVTQAAGIRQSCVEMENTVRQLDIDIKDTRDLMRHIENIRACVDEMDGDNWLKSPRAMAEERAQGDGHG